MTTPAINSLSVNEINVALSQISSKVQQTGTGGNASSKTTIIDRELIIDPNDKILTVDQDRNIKAEINLVRVANVIYLYGNDLSNPIGSITL